MGGSGSAVRAAWMLTFVLAARAAGRRTSGPRALALSTLAGWFGLRIMHLGWLTTMSLRPYALGYSALVVASGAVVKTKWFECAGTSE